MCDDPDEVLPQFLRTTRMIVLERQQEGARFLAEPWAGFPSWAPNCQASNDLRGGASGIARPVASARRPRQNSQDRSLIHPGSASSMASTNREGPSVFSRRRTSANEAKSIAWARIRAWERGCTPTGSHQQQRLSSSLAKSAGRLSASDVCMLSI